MDKKEYEKDELKKVLNEELLWIQYRARMLDLIEDKLLQMKEMVEDLKQGNLSKEEIGFINVEMNRLTVEINALDEESRRTENGGGDWVLI